jgi:hypothetical protein
MRKIILTAVAVAGTAAVLTGCAAQGVTNTPDSEAPAATQPAAQGTAAPSAATSSSSPAPAAARVGSTITLKGNTDELIAVTLVKVAPVAKPKDVYFTPDKGNRLFAVQFRITNKSTAAYEDSPTNGAKAIDAEGQQYDTSMLDSTLGQSIAGSVKLLPGRSVLGVINYEVPAGAKITSVQMSADSGFGESGEWVVG